MIRLESREAVVWGGLWGLGLDLSEVLASTSDLALVEGEFELGSGSVSIMVMWVEL